MQVEEEREKRDQIEGFKVSKTEKKEIADYCKKHNHDKSKFFRNAIARAMERGD